MIHKTAVAVLATVAACAAAPAAAQSPWYAAGSWGTSSIEVDPGAVDGYALRNGFTTSTTTTQDDDRAWKVQLGYRFAPMWSMELGYTSLGEATYNNVNNLGSFDGKKEADAWNIDVVGTFPLNPTWAILGRLGAVRWETKSDMPRAGGTVGVKDNGYSFKYGAGVQFSMTPNIDIRAEYERFHKVGEQNTTGEAGVNMYSIGAVLKF